MSSVNRSSSRGFTLIELLVVVAIIALLVAILLPSLGKAREYAKSAACQANMRSVAMSVLLYGESANGLPPMYMKDGARRPQMVPVDRPDQPISSARDRFYKIWWSGVMMDQSMMQRSSSTCPNPRGYTGVDTSTFPPINHAGRQDTAVWPPYPVEAGLKDTSGQVWYPGEDYDYALSFRVAFEGCFGAAGKEKPTLYNAGIASKVVLMMEWNWRRDLNWNDNGLLNHGSWWANFGPGHFRAVGGPDDWGNGIRMTRHIGGNGTNNFAFADGHVATPKMRWDHVWGLLRVAPPAGVTPWQLYPDIAFNSSTTGSFAWMNAVN